VRLQLIKDWLELSKGSKPAHPKTSPHQQGEVCDEERHQPFLMRPQISPGGTDRSARRGSEDRASRRSSETVPTGLLGSADPSGMDRGGASMSYRPPRQPSNDGRLC